MKGILVCLKCGSAKLKRKTIIGIIPSSSYICSECGFESPIMLEVFPEKKSDKSS